MASVNMAILKALEDHRPVTIKLERSLTDNLWQGYLLKSIRALIGCARILSLPRNRRKTFYSSVDDGLGGILIAVLTAAARFRRCRIILHHHSYAYITRSTWIMQLIVRIAGKQTTHVFLCEEMERDFRTLYPRPFRAVVCPNPVSDPAMLMHFSEPPDPTPQASLTIGFLSNLMFEKGLSDFVELIRQASAYNLELRGVMAGPAFSPEAQSFVDEASKELDERLTLTGPVYEASKILFFESIDILVFPTRYPTEALPLVLVEALLAGCPVITYGRGCIPMFQKLEPVHVISPSCDFTTAALPILKDWSKSYASLSKLKTKAYIFGHQIQDRHMELRNKLVDLIEN